MKCIHKSRFMQVPLLLLAVFLLSLFLPIGAASVQAAGDTLIIKAWNRQTNAFGAIILAEGYQYPVNPTDLRLSGANSGTTVYSIEWRKKNSSGEFVKDTTGRFSAGTWRCLIEISGTSAFHNMSTGEGRINFEGLPSNTTWQAPGASTSRFVFTSSPFTINESEIIDDIYITCPSLISPEIGATIPDLSGQVKFSINDTAHTKGVSITDVYWSKFVNGSNQFSESSRVYPGDTFSAGTYFLNIEFRCSDLAYKFDSSDTDVYFGNATWTMHRYLKQDGTFRTGEKYNLELKKDGFTFNVQNSTEKTLELINYDPSYGGTDILIPEKVTFGSDTYTVTNIRYHAFEYNTTIRSVTIPASVTFLEGKAFDDCEILETVIFAPGSRLKRIPYEAFYYCQTLKKIELPASVEEIGEEAFVFCTALEEVTFEPGSHLREIGIQAFKECLSLKEINLPASLKTLKEGAFEYCSSLKTIRFEKGSVLDTIDERAIDSGTDKNPVCIWYYDDDASVGAVVDQYCKECVGTDKKARFSIIALKDVAKCTVAAIADQIHTGKAITPALTVTYKGTPMKQGTDYTVTWKNNTNIGTASLTLTGKSPYYGTITKQFTIISSAADTSASTIGDETVVTPKNPAALTTISKAIKKTKTEKDLANSTYYLLQAKGVPKSKSSVKLTWKKVSGATEYIIYGNKCGKKQAYKEITRVKGKSFTNKKLKKGTYYKYLIVAVRGKKALAVSKTIHVATKGGKVGNNTKVTLSKTKLTLKKGKTKTIKATSKKGSLKVKTHRKTAWESANPSVATVSAKGKIKAVGKGTCYIYAYAQNGMKARIRVTVK